MKSKGTSVLNHLERLHPKFVANMRERMERTKRQPFQTGLEVAEVNEEPLLVPASIDYSGQGEVANKDEAVSNDDEPLVVSQMNFEEQDEEANSTAVSDDEPLVAPNTAVSNDEPLLPRSTL